MGRKVKKVIDNSTEEKIKESARKLFTQKGYATVKTRDIAEEAGINLALLNYYFRSKEKLFNIIMMESMEQFIQGIAPLFNNKKSTLNEKIEMLVENYLNMLIKFPELPLFILSEMRNHPQNLILKFDSQIDIAKSDFMQQAQQTMKSGKVHQIHFMHFIANLIGLMVFPFVASPILKKVTKVNDKQFIELMEERKKMIPIWIKAMMIAK